MSFGMRPSSILHTWPSQRSRLWVSMAYMLGRPVRDRTSAILKDKGSMITAKRTTDQELVTRNSSSFKKLPNPPEEVIRESSPVPPVELQATLEFDGPETIEHTEMPANQEEFNPVTPSETILVKDNHLPTTVEQPSHHHLPSFLEVEDKSGDRSGPRTMLTFLCFQHVFYRAL